ncbi:MAG: hypothetical protein KKA67_11890 [Spirochaetes bacterium]|nr:hypothetical protein [Spirochaetota bacterium]MBU1081860.1 hypothetical protein [Spirochaetota bacterium]
MKHTCLSALLALALGLIPLVGVEAQASASAIKDFPDFLAVRSEFLSALITAAPARALSFKTVFRNTPAGRIRVSVERDGEEFFVLFQRERDGGFSAFSRGDVVIKREVATGYVKRVVWFLSDDGASFISLTPKNERTIVDFVVAGAVSRGSYSVSRLIYQFFTNSFSYLVSSTRSGLDWPSVLGAPGPEAASAMAASLVSGEPGIAQELLGVAEDLTSVGSYLSAAGLPDSALAEEQGPREGKAAAFADPRDPVLKAVPDWSEVRGMSMEVAAAPIIAGVDSSSVFIALVSGTGEQASRKLVVVPYRDEAGAYVIRAVDADSREAVDFLGLVRSMPGAAIRLFRLPLPRGL